ncbi:MAG: hypothetical protein GKR92_13235 [Gammaproteobacteria bacterium]|nr:MAG: hypothetical protein GKR92_13235 [Gammaproteobacteria bacterium]
MGNSKQEASIKVSQVEAKQVSTHKVKASNGNSNDELLVDEVKKLDQIRAMLFGEHVATLQNKHQALNQKFDKNLDQSVSILRKEFATSIADLQQQIDKKFNQLRKSLQSEEANRESQNEELTSSLSGVNSDILTKIDLEAKRLDQALEDQHLESTNQLNSMAGSLQDTKVDRKSLAALFSQFAKELEGS